MDEAERQELVEFWEENQTLFETLGQRLEECAMTNNMKRFGLYVNYLKLVVSLGLQLAAKMNKAERESAHA
jgi:hypothetical protein